MKVLVDPRAGFCGGVRRVVKMAEQHLHDTGRPLVSLGDVIHNEVEIGRLKELGLSGTGYEMLDGEGTAARQLLIRAHGEPPETYRKAERLGIELIDGTCPVVTRSQEIARSHYLAGEQVVIVGKPYHPEAERQPIVPQCRSDWAVVQPWDELQVLMCLDEQRIDHGRHLFG